MGLLGAASARGEMGEGLVRIARAQAVPVIDGVLEDACWARAIEIAPFVLQRQSAFAQDETVVRAAYDDTNLYLAFRCGQRCLDPVNNQLGAFKANTKARDDDRLFKDDCVLALLDTTSDRDSFYDVCVNGAGAVCDASCAGPDPWSTRDKAWASGGKTAVSVGNGYWVVEIALPFANLGGTPKVGTQWRVCFGRIQQADKENSTWRPMSTGFHNADEFGVLEFADSVPGVSGLDLGTLCSGENQLSVTVCPDQPGTAVRAETCTSAPGRGRTVVFTDAVLQAEQTVAHTYELAEEGRLQFQWSLLDPASLAVYYRSPAYDVEVTVSQLSVAVSGEEAFTVYLNGREVAQAASGGAAGSAALVSGVNVIGIVAAGWVEGSFTVGDFVLETDHTWKVASTPDEGWAKRAFDDSSWAQVKSRTQRLGADGEKRCYRKTLLLGTSMFWPNWSAASLSIAANSVQQLLWVPQGLPGRTLTDLSLYLEVPAPFRIVGASGYYGKGHGRDGFLFGNRGEVERDGQTYRRYLIRALDAVTVQKSIPHWRMCSIAVELPDRVTQTEQQDWLFYHSLHADKGAIQEIPQSLRVTALPPLRGKQPTSYAWQTTGGSTSVMDDVECGTALTASLTRAGFNQIWHGRALPKFSAANLAMFGFNSWQIDCRPYLEKHPEHALIGSDGKPRFNPADGRGNQIAPSLLLRDTEAWEFVRDALIDWVRENEIDHLDWDFEYSVWDDKGGTHGNPIADFGPLALADFRASCGIDAGTDLTPAIIKAEYPEQWIRFMNQRLADLWGRLRQALKEPLPEVVFSVYSGYQCAETHSYYGVDWSMLAGKIDMAICGYGRRVAEIKATLEALGDTPLVVGNLIVPYRAEERAFPTCTSMATFLRRALDGTGGVLIWTFNNLDGRTFFAAAEVSKLVAEFEDMFLSRRVLPDFVTATGIAPGDITVLSDATRRLLLLINETGQVKRVELTLNGYRDGMSVQDYYAGTQLAAGAEFVTSIPANGIKAFVVNVPQ